MKVASFVSYLDSRGISLWLDAGQLRFRAAKNALTADLRKEIVRRKPEIIAFLSQQWELEPIPSIDRNRPIPLSFAQQRLWFLSQLEDDGQVYNIPSQLCLSGTLDVPRLEAAFQKLEQRHEILRTTFTGVDGDAQQQIHPSLFVLEIIDAEGWALAAQKVERARLTQRELHRAFDLATGPLWRATLLRLDAQNHVLYITIHHIISDGWSMAIFMHELSALYAGQSLPDLSIQYADYASWQRDWLQGSLLEAQMAYWTTQLADAPALLTLPTDYPRPAVQTGKGNHYYFSLTPTLTIKLKQLSQTCRATLFMTLEAAFALLLSRYAEQEDVLVGTPIANRPLPELEGLLGLFLNALVIRNDLTGEPTFRELLVRVRQASLDAFERQSLPFEMLVEQLKPPRSLAHTPVFQVMFNLLNTRSEQLKLEDVNVQFVEPEALASKHDLTLIMQEENGVLSGALEYSTDLFSAETMARFAGHFEQLLEGVVADSDRPIAKLPLLTPSERHKMLVTWNDNPSDYVIDRCYHQLFEQKVVETPDAIAVVSQVGGRVIELTYRELNQRANQLAHQLRSLGVESDQLVGVYMERSQETIISLLAIFKAGGAYVPLDPALPNKRLQYMVTQSRPPIILTKRSMRDKLPDNHQAQLICLDSDDFAYAPTENVSTQSTLHSLAYVLFTSGSTGVPKGVMVEQRGMVNNLQAKILDHGMTSADKMAQTAPPSFDISMWQFLAALLVGGTVRIFDDEIARDPVRLIDHTEQEDITVLEIVPSLFRFMLDEIEQRASARPLFAALRWLSLTGEALPPMLCNEWFVHYPHIPILNAYGPAECSDDATHQIIDAPFPENTLNTPIGKPLPNVRLYVLDAQMQPVPIGVRGELCIGGIGVGRGYINDPERTAKVFMDDPFSAEPNARLYKTGDAVCYRADGTLEFLGRFDFQVKIRGLRIELGEIESLLDRHPLVEKAVVAVQPAADGGKQLVGYLSAREDQQVSQTVHAQPVEQWQTLHEQTSRDKQANMHIDLLRKYLSDQLPSYMVPNRFIVLDEMPLTPNGKVDRKRLPLPEIGETVDVSQMASPETPTQKALCGIWQEVLRIKPVGIHNNFFELGGHSLLATQVVSRVRKVWALELPLRQMFMTPTVAELAIQIDDLLAVKQAVEMVASEIEDEREEIAI